MALSDDGGDDDYGDGDEDESSLEDEDDQGCDGDDDQDGGQEDEGRFLQSLGICQLQSCMSAIQGKGAPCVVDRLSKRPVGTPKGLNSTDCKFESCCLMR